MSLRSTLEGVAGYFGGAYDPATRTYRASPVPGVGVVRRAYAKRDDRADYFNGMPKGARTGCQIVVRIPDHSETRFALGGAHDGRKTVVYAVELQCFIYSFCEHAEDAQDDVFDLIDALKDHIRADRTLGGAVFEAGEHVEGGSGSIDVHLGEPETKNEVTKSYAQISFPAVEIVAA